MNPFVDGGDPFSIMARSAGGGASLDDLDIPVPTCWADVPADDVPAAWTVLRDWVECLRARFGLDPHVLPACWWRHNAHVEALIALRDHEAASYLDTSPATAPVDWLRALRDVTAMLRAWTGELGCDATHRDPPVVPVPAVDEAVWEAHITADKARRARTEERIRNGGERER